MVNKLACSVHWGIVKEDIRPLVQLLAELLKTFNNN